MGIFDFFRKKISNVQDVEDSKVEKQVKQGFYREREYILPNSNYTRLSPEFLMTLSGEYKDGVREGLWTVEDKKGQKGYINYTAGLKHGLERSPDGVYTLYHCGQAIKSHLELKREWKRTVREWRMVKEGDKEGRSATLKEVLAAKTKEEKKKVLKGFHSSKTPQGYTRRTAVKFNKKASRD